MIVRTTSSSNTAADNESNHNHLGNAAVDSSNWSVNHEDPGAEKNPFLEMSQDQIQKLDAVLSTEQAQQILGVSSAQLGLHVCSQKLGYPLGTDLDSRGSERTVEDNLDYAMNSAKSEDFFHVFDAASGVIHVAGPDLLVGDVEVEMAAEILAEEVCQSPHLDLAHFEYCIALDHSYCSIPMPEPVCEQEVIADDEAPREIAMSAECDVQSCDTEAASVVGGSVPPASAAELSVVASPMRRSQRQIEKLEREQVERIKAENAELLRREVKEAWGNEERDANEEKEHNGMIAAMMTTDDKGERTAAPNTAQHCSVEHSGDDQAEKACSDASAEHLEGPPTERPEEVPLAVQTTDGEKCVVGADRPTVTESEVGQQQSVNTESRHDCVDSQGGSTNAAVDLTPPLTVARHRDTSMKNITLAELKDAAFLAAPPQQIFACDGDSVDAIDEPLEPLVISSSDVVGLSVVPSSQTIKKMDHVGAADSMMYPEQTPDVCGVVSSSSAHITGEAFTESFEQITDQSPQLLRRRPSGGSQVLEPSPSKEDVSLLPEKPSVAQARKSYPKRENRKPPGRLMDMFEPALFSKPDRMKKVEARWEDEIPRPKHSPERLKSPSATQKSVPVAVKEESSVVSSTEANKNFEYIEEYLARVEGDSDVVLKSAPVVVENEISLVSKDEVWPPLSGGVKDHARERLLKKNEPRAAEVQKRDSSKLIGVRKTSTGLSSVKREEGQSSANRKQKAGNASSTGSSSSDESGDSSDWCSEDDPDRLWCICKQPHNGRFMISCDQCEDWFHGSCVGVTRKQGRELEKSGKEWVCAKCAKERLLKKVEKAHPKESSDVPVSKLTSEEKTLVVPEKCRGKPSPVDRVSSTPTVGAEPRLGKKPVKLVRGVPRAPASGPASKLCIVGCDRLSRADSIYCSSECILQHANESLKILGREKEKRIQLKNPDSVRQEQLAAERIVVLERRTGRILTGPNAPTESNLHEWLKHNPTFEVLHPGKKAIARSSFYSGVRREPPKAIKLISAKPMPVEPPAKESSRSRTHSVELKSPVVITPSVPEKKMVTPEKKTLPTEKKVTPPEKKALPPEKKVTSVLERRPSLKEVKPSAEVKPSLHSPVSAPTTPTNAPQVTPGPEPIRLNVRKTLKEILTTRSNDADDVLLSSDEIKTIAVRIEDELFKVFNDTGAKYKAKYRSLMFNIKDSRNHGLFRKILRGKIPPYKLVRMTPEELASKELAMWRERETKHTLEMIKREQEEQLQQQHVPIIKKTHKGEIEIDENDLGFADKAKTKAESGVEVISDMLVDTTDAHRSHLFDLNCKICTGKMLPPAETDVQPKGVRVAKSISVESKSQTEDEEEEEAASQTPPLAQMTSSEPSLSPKHEEKGKSEKKSGISASKEKDKKQQQQLGAKKKSVKSKEKEDGTKGKKRVKVVKSSLKKYDEKPSGSSDREPTSTVTIGSPDSGIPSQSDADSKAPQSVWKGFIVMQDVTKFVASAHKVSGPTDFLAQDIPDTILVCGRIKPNMVWDYLSKMKQSASKEFLVIRFSPANDEEKVAYVSFYTYLSSRNRFGVVGNTSKMVKDFYILPLASESSIPATLLPFDGPGLDETRPHMLLGVIIRHKGKRRTASADGGDSSKAIKKRKGSVAVDVNDQTSNDEGSKGLAKKVKFNLSANAVSALDEEEAYEPSYTPPLLGRKLSSGGEMSPNEGSFTPPLPSQGSGDSPYDPMDDDDDDENKPYDPEEAEAAVKVSKSIIPGLLKGSVSSQSVSELIEQISLSSNPTGITSTVLASIATATNLEQQRKLLIELTQKVEEQKRQLERQKQQIATKVTQQVMGAMNTYSLASSVQVGVVPSAASLPVALGTAPVDVMAGVAGATTVKSNDDDDDEAYSQSYTPPPVTSVSVTTLETPSLSVPVATMKLPDTRTISLPPNLQEILESIKKKGAMTDNANHSQSEVASAACDLSNVSTGVASTLEFTAGRSQAGNSVLEDPIVKNFATVSDLEGEEERSEGVVAKVLFTDIEATVKEVVDEEEQAKSRAEDGQPKSSLLPKQPQCDPRLKGKSQKVDPRVKQSQESLKKSELGSLSDRELMEKALKQFEESLPLEKPKTVISQQPPPSHSSLGVQPTPPKLSSGRIEPPPPGLEESGVSSGSFLANPDATLHPGMGSTATAVPYPLHLTSYPPPNPVGVPMDSSGFSGPIFPPPLPPPPIFPAYRSSFPAHPPAGGGYWTERGPSDWRGRPHFRGRGGRGRWQDNGHRGDWDSCAMPCSSTMQNTSWLPHERDDRKDWNRGDRDDWNRDRHGERGEWDRDRHGDRSDCEKERHGERDDCDRDRRGDRDDHDRDRHRDRDRRDDRKDRRDRDRGSREKDRDRDRDKDREKDRSRSRHRD